MPRSSFSDNPLLRVSRPVSACSRCRLAKVKCDGKLPACTACEKAGRENECSSANDQFARGKERSYVAALELRIEKMEKQLAFARSRKASVNLHDVDEATAPADRKDSMADIRAAIHRKAARKREDTDVNSLVSDFGYLSVNATTRDFEPSTSNMTFARLVLAAAICDEVPDPTEDSVPTRAEALATIQYYMANIYTLFPCFSETHLLTILDDVYQQDERAKDLLKDADFWLFYMVLAIGHAAQSKGGHDESYRRGLDFVARALPFADKALMPGYPTQIQSLILFTQYAMLDPAHFDSWYLIGFASRAVVDLGFHQDPPRSQVSDKAGLDLRRKMFYCVYALDRTISMIRTKAFSFTDDSINVEYPNASGPSPSGALTGPRSADPALLLFHLRRTQSEWYQALFQADSGSLPDSASFIWQMCLEMREWHENLPDGLPAGIRELFELELRYSYVYCLAPSSERSAHMTDYVRKLIFEHAMAYINTIHSVVHAPTNTAFYTSLDVFKVYFVAMQFFTVFSTARDLLLSNTRIIPPITLPGTAPPPPLPHRQGNEDSVDRSIRCLRQVVETLRKLSERWEMASQLKERFNDISSDLFSWVRVQRQMRDQRAQQPQPQPQPQQPQRQQQQRQQQQRQQQQQQQQQPQHHLYQQNQQRPLQLPPGPSPPQTHHQTHHQSHPSHPPPPQQQVFMASSMPMPGMMHQGQSMMQQQPMMQHTGQQMMQQPMSQPMQTMQPMMQHQAEQMMQHQAGQMMQQQAGQVMQQPGPPVMQYLWVNDGSGQMMQGGPSPG